MSETFRKRCPKKAFRKRYERAKHFWKTFQTRFGRKRLENVVRENAKKTLMENVWETKFVLQSETSKKRVLENVKKTLSEFSSDTKGMCVVFGNTMFGVVYGAVFGPATRGHLLCSELCTGVFGTVFGGLTLCSETTYVHSVLTNS